jgi:hypothetical protein
MLRFFTAVIVQLANFSGVTSSGLENEYQRFGATNRLHLYSQLNLDTGDGRSFFLRRPQSDHYRSMKSLALLVVMPCIWREPEFSEEYIAFMFRVEE